MLKSKLIVLLGAIVIASPVWAGDAAKGKEKSVACAACHGAAGVSAAPIFPNLAGQKEDYLKAQLKAFKAGTRKNDMMSPMAAGLSDADIDNLAAYFSASACK